MLIPNSFDCAQTGPRLRSGRKHAAGRCAATLALLLPLIVGLSACVSGSNGLPSGLPVPNPGGLRMTTTLLADGINGRTYTMYTIVAGGTSPYVCGSSGLPAGLGVSTTTVPSGALAGMPACLISGTPTATGSTVVTITVNDSSAPPQSASVNLSLNVRAEFSFNAAVLPVGVVGRTYGVAPQTAPVAGTTVSGTTGNAPLTMCAVSGTGGNSTLGSAVSGAGCTLSSSSSLSTNGAFNLTFMATDSPIIDTTGTGLQVVPPNTISSSATPFTVNAALAVNAFALGNGETTATYSQTIGTTGGLSPLTSCSIPGLPAGLGVAVNAVTNCLLSGTPTATFATAMVTLTAMDSGNSAVPSGSASGNSNLTIGLGPTLAAFVLPAGQTGTAYGPVNIAINNGNGPYTCAFTAPSASPGGLSVAASGSNCVVSGTPNATFGPASVTITVTDTPPSASSGSGSGSGNASLTISAPITITFTLGDGEVSATYNKSIPISGGTGPYSCAFTAPSANPGGLSVAASGSNCVVSGPATAVFGPQSVTITVTDANTNTGSGSSSLTIFSRITVNAFTLGNGVQNRAFSQLVGTTGGSGNTLTACNLPGLPSGLAASVSGTNCLISGTPTVTFTSAALTLTATDQPSGTDSGPATSLGVNSPLNIFSPLAFGAFPRIINGLNGFTYPGITFTATGGTNNGASLNWTQGGSSTALCTPTGAPPSGLMLGATTGMLTGTSTPVGNFTFQVCVEDMPTTSTAAASITSSSFNLRVVERLAFAAGTGDSSLEVVNTGTNTFVQTIALASGTSAPRGVAVSSDGLTAYVIDNANNTVIPVDTNSLTAGTAVAMPNKCGSPTEVATTPNPTAAGHDRLYVICTDTTGPNVEELAVFDTTNLAGGAVAQIPTGNGTAPAGVAIQSDNSQVFVTLNGTNELFVIDNTVAAGSLAGTAHALDGTADQPTQIAVVAHGASVYAYIGKQGPGSQSPPVSQAVDVEDVTTGTPSFVTNILYTAGTTFNPDAITVDPSGSFVYVALPSQQQFDVIDNTQATPVEIAGAPFNLPDPSMAAADSSFGVTIPPVPSGTTLAYFTARFSDQLDVLNVANPPTANTTVGVTATSAPQRIASVPLPK